MFLTLNPKPQKGLALFRGPLGAPPLKKNRVMLLHFREKKV